jgi:flagellar motor component MotA
LTLWADYIRTPPSAQSLNGKCCKPEFKMSIILGYLFLILNIIIVIAMTTDKLKIYLDLHSVICVVGGTALSAVIGFGGDAIKRIIRIYGFSIKKKPPDIKG